MVNQRRLIKVVGAIKVLDKLTALKYLGGNNVNSQRSTWAVYCVHSLIYLLFVFFLSHSNFTPIGDPQGLESDCNGEPPRPSGLSEWAERPPDLHGAQYWVNTAKKREHCCRVAEGACITARGTRCPRQAVTHGPLSKSARKGWREPLASPRDY